MSVEAIMLAASNSNHNVEDKQTKRAGKTINEKYRI